MKTFSLLLLFIPFTIRYAINTPPFLDRNVPEEKYTRNVMLLTQINASSFGFLPSATAAENTKALQRISEKINSLSGGVTLMINKGSYTVGSETFARGRGKGYAYFGQKMLTLTGCTKPVVIEGSEATIKLASGLHFGSFQSVTGARHNAPAGGFYNYDYVAYPQSIIEVVRNKSVIIRNLVLNGNVQNLTVGGYWGDTGIQLPGDGIYGSDNDELTVDRVRSNYFPRDGIQIGNHTPDAKAPVRKVFLLNSTFDGNTRQGFSWVGGNHLYALNCRFINTGKTVNVALKSAIVSAPGAGIDMEAELGLIRNGVFENCVIDNNSGAGLLSVGDVASISFNGGKIIGATSWSIYGSGPKAVFNKTTIVGSPVNLRTGTGPADKDNTQFTNCLITMDSTLSPTKKVYGNYVMDFGGGGGGFFNNCIIDSKKRGTVYGGGGCVFTNCTFKQEPTAAGYNGYPFMSGTFYGTNRWIRPGAGGMLPNLDKSKFYGPFYVNDVEVTGKK
ncbi:MAG TPA: hypothetical protein VM884_01980 [Flavisolibacter sp.]|jgi:hypothetical protein|nr:hypothetical protein [Flavisolibacter sp.]